MSGREAGSACNIIPTSVSSFFTLFSALPTRGCCSDKLPRDIGTSVTAADTGGQSTAAGEKPTPVGQ